MQENIDVRDLQRLARAFDSVAKTYRDVRLHGPASDAEAKKLVFETIAANANVADRRAA
jgi:hypothetical protein